ncbi:Ig-like domain-containing protein [Mycobacterium sp. SMC-4]|uniref:Ig-like domain-containing protein n=1 Tax=Mycobacterium sp. SMC-4 TaxID=2857059 RepID=UPI003CFF2103
MAYTKHIGRVGALAFALGVGFGLGAAPGVAVADDSASTGATSARADDTTPTRDRDRRPSRAGSASERTQRTADVSDEPVDEPAGSNNRHRTLLDEDSNDTAPADATEAEPDDIDPPVEPVDASTDTDPTEISAPEPVTAPAVEVVIDTAATSEPAATEPVDDAAESVAVTVSPTISTLLSPTGPDAPMDSPALWVLMAAARRQVGRLDDARLSDSGAQVQRTSLLTAQQALDIRRIGDVAVGLAPTDVVATNTRAYVANSGSNSITVIDTVGGSVLQTISLSSAPTRLAVNEAGTRLYVSSAQAGTVSVVDTTTSEVIRTVPVGDVPTGIVVSGNRVYVVNSADGTVSKISTLTNRLVGTVRGVAEGVSSIVVSANGSRIFTTSHQSGDLSYFSPLSLSATTITGVTTGSVGLTLNADGSRLYVADPSGSVQVIDTAAREVVDTIAVTSGRPFSVALSADGAQLYVAHSDGGTLSVYDLETKAELGTIVANPHAVTAAPALARTPDGLQLYLADPTSNRVQILSLVGPNADPVAQTPVIDEPTATGVVNGSVVVTDADGNPLSYTVSRPGKGNVKVTQSGGTFTFVYTPTATARHAAAAVGAAAEAKQDTFTLTVSDGQRGVVTIPINVTIKPANAIPSATFRARSSLFSANVTGTITVRDADRDAITFTASETAKGGTVELDADGTFTYTPSAAARHAAAAADATAADKQDTFTVTVDDGHGGVTALTVTVKVKPGNTKPRASVRVAPSLFSAAVYGRVTARDSDGDPVTYAVTTPPEGGEVTLGARGTFTYTPTAAARHAAAATDATDADTQDTFDITVDDGHGGRTTVTVTVRIKPLNVAPSRPTVGDVTTGINSGVVIGKISAGDTDGDTLTFTARPTTRKGTVAIAADGTFTYTPTEAAREAASGRFAPSWVKRDSFIVRVDDGHGGVRLVTVRVPIAPVHVNQSPTDGAFTAGEPDPVSGRVIGTVTATDAENDALTFSAPIVTAKGAALVASNGSFVYTPNDIARHRVTADDATDADKIDTFTVTVNDGYGGTLTVPVTVKIAPSLNQPPTDGSFSFLADPVSGVVTGIAVATDADGDALRYSGTTATAKGYVIVQSGGSYTYTPSDAARLAAGAPDARRSDKEDMFTITANDGHGGVLGIPIRVPVVGLPSAL